MFHRAAMLLCFAAVLALTACDWWSAGSEPKPKAKSSDTTELTVFAHQHIPEVERLVDDLAMQIVDQQSRLQSLGDALRLGNRDPKTDAEHRKWSDKIASLESLLEETKTLRADTFIAWKKHLLDTGKDSTAESMAAAFDAATVRAAKQREEVAAIIAGLPSTRPAPVSPVDPAKTAAGAGTKSTGSTPARAAPRVVILPLRNATTAQVTVTEFILAGEGGQRHTIKAPFDQYSHGPRTSLSNWVVAQGGGAVNRAEVDALLVSPSPAAASRGIADAAGLEVARRLGAAYVLTGEFDTIAAVKKPRPENTSTTRDLFAVTVRFRLDLLRVTDGQRVAAGSFEFNDTIIEGQFRGFGDATVAARIVRGIAATVQNDQAFAQAVKAAMQ